MSSSKNDIKCDQTYVIQFRMECTGIHGLAYIVNQATDIEFPSIVVKAPGEDFGSQL